MLIRYKNISSECQFNSEPGDQTGLQTCTPLAGESKVMETRRRTTTEVATATSKGTRTVRFKGETVRFEGGDSKPDRWLCRGRDLTWTREHRTPRRQLFNPDEAERGPNNVNQLWYFRKKIGVMEDGRKFNVTDDWTRGGYEGACMIRQAWTGRTTFIMRTPEGRLDKMQTTKQ